MKKQNYFLQSSNGLMKIKNLMYVLALWLICGNANAQISGKYTFSYVGTVTYASIAGTTLQSAAAGVSVDAVFPAIPIGFSFNFNCQTYTTCGISNNGFIWFGTGSPATTNYTPLSSTTGQTGTIDGIIAVAGSNITGSGATAAIRYITSGTAPNRTFTAEWKSVLEGGVERCDHEIRLTETSGKIELIGFDNSYLVSGTANIQRGIMASTSDFKNLKTSGGNLCSPLAGTLNTDVCQILATSACGYMTSASSQAINHTFSFTGSCCTPPTSTATAFGYSNVVVNGTSSTADFSFTRGNGDGGVIAIVKDVSAPSAPSNGSVPSPANPNYGSGAAVGGGFLVYAETGQAIGAVRTVNLTGLTNGHTYFVAVYEYAATATCYVGTPLSGNIPIPSCSPPSAQASGNSVSNIQTTQADINWTGNGNGDDVIVFFKQGSAISTDPTQTTNYNANAGFGLGDQIGATGARAVYKGTGSTVTVTGLTTNITYFYAIYAHNATTNCYTVPPVTGSFTTSNSPMTTSAQNVTQSSVATVTPSSTNNQIIRLEMVCGTGTAPALVMSQLFFTTAATNGGTTNPADIANAKVYYTGTSSAFATTTQYGSTIVSPNGAFIVSGSTTLVPGSNYFWLTYDITASPTINDFVDAKLSTIDVGAILTPSGDPAGNRQITLTYCTPTAMGGCACSSCAAGAISIASASLSGTTFYSGGACNTVSPFYNNLTGSVIASALTGTSYTLTLNSSAATSAYGTTYAAWIDWDNNGTFGNNGNENIIISGNVYIAGGGALTITSPSFVPPSAGAFRMRVTVWGGQFGLSAVIGPCTGSGSYYGEWKDFTINVAASSTPMTYSSSTTTQNTSPAPPNINNQQIVGLQVVTSGALTPISLTSLTFNTNGSTAIATDATNARVFYTGTNGTYSAAGQFGSTIANPNGSYTLTGSQTLSPGTNYFWVAYDVPSSATIGDNLDAECTSIIVGGTTYTPSITAPTGARPIGLVYCVPSGGATACSLGGDDVITSVTLTGTGSTFNFTGGTCLTPYPNNYQINPYTGNVNQGVSYTTTMIKSGSSYGARFIAWIDFNNNGVFTDAGEKIMDVTQTAASATGASFTVPALAPVGGHRMRTWIGYTGTIVASDITSVVTGCEVLNGSNNQGEVRDFTVNVISGCSAPVFTTCPGNISLNTASGLCSAVATYTTSVSGTSPVVTYAFTGATTASGSGDGSGSTFNTGTTVVTVTATNGCGTAPCTYNVVVTDNQSPVPNVASLPNITGECSATATAPTATDNCAGSVTGTTPDPLSYSTQGTFTIHWTYSDGNGNSSTQNQTVIVLDDIAPVANVTSLPNVTGECSATATAPTATDNCVGSVTGTTPDPLSYSTQGTFTIHWTYSDGNGNSSTQNQTVIVLDDIAPVADITTLPSVTGECLATATAPTATDNCVGSVTGTTTDPLSYSTQGTFTIHWTYSDGNGNSSTQNQTVIVNDNIGPVPDVTTLATVTGECSATVSATPTATDNCTGINVQGTTPDPLSYSTHGTFTIHWTYSDGNGNSSTQNQTVIVLDDIAPVADVTTLSTVTGECSATATAPTATDNCVGSVTGTTPDPLSYSTQGTFTIHWTYSDGNGNSTTQNQTVIVNDDLGPVPDVTTLATVSGECSATVSATPTATDNCTGINVQGTTSDPLSYSTQGTFTIHWTYNDGNGNTSTQNQTVIVLDDIAPVANVTTLANVTGECSAAATAPTATDNCVGSVTGTTPDPLSYSTQGTFTIHWTYSDGNGNFSTQNQTVIVLDDIAPVVNVTTLSTITGECSVTATAPTATDNCDGSVTGTTTDPLSYSTQGTFTIHWTYSDGNGNTSTQNQTVIVHDVTNPAISGCPGNITSCNPIVTWTAPTASDNCGTPSLNSNYNPGATFPLGATSVTYTANDGNGNTATCSFTVTVIANPTAVISNNSSICLGQPAAVHLVFTGTGPWNYTISDGSQTVTGSTSANPVNINITPVSIGVHNYNVTILSDANCSGNSTGTAVVSVSSAPPANSIGTITAPLQACSGDVTLVTVNTVAGQNITYSWNTGTNSSVVLYSANVGGPFVSGPFSTTAPSVYAQFGSVVSSGYNICVQGVNGCGSTNNGCTFIRGKVGVPTSINGAIVACANDIKPYSCALSGGASLYTWTLAGSASPITSGQGTANVSVTFPAAFTSGQLCVTAALACGGSSTSAPRCVTISNTPVVPGAMTGPAKVCPGQTGVAFSVPAVTGASGYNWTVPVGATITSGANTTAITVSFPASYTGAPPVCVYALSSCASSVGRCKTVGSNIPGQPGSMTGPTTGVCNSTVQYSISNVTLATSYTWTIPAGSTNFLGQGSTSIQFAVPASFTSGQVTVVANTTACTPGTSIPRTITINGAPATPGIITPNPSAWCDAGFVNFSIVSASPLPVYQWVVTNGTIDAGQNSNNIDVTWGTGAGVVKVRGTNSCGASSYRVLNTSSAGCKEQESFNFSQYDNISVYPNPTHDKVTIEINNSIDEHAHVSITDLAGKLVFTEQMQFTKGLTTFEIDLTHLAKGAYMLSVEKTSDTVRQRIMVQ